MNPFETGANRWAQHVRSMAAVVAFSCAALLSFCLSLSPEAVAQRTQLKPGFNAFTPQQDIALGKRVAADAEKQLALCNDPKVDAYLTQLGLRLAAKLPTNGVEYPFEFHCVNEKAINAFALPGGYVFINRGAIEVADNEAQLAGVMAHELSHVALRHGTNQATKAEASQGILGIFSEIFGDSTGGAVLTGLSAFAVGGVLLRYSRTAESQADILGTQVLYDAVYDPRAMGQFFEKLEAETKGKNPPEFFSDHPSPEHRVERVNEEIEKLGSPLVNATRDSKEFEAIKRKVLALPPGKKPAPGTPASPGASAAPVPPAPPSRSFVQYNSYYFALKYPDNWKAYPGGEGGETEGVSFMPENGMVSDESGNGTLAYGLMVRFDASIPGEVGNDEVLSSGTDEVLNELQRSNPDMKIVRQGARLRVNSQPGLSAYLSNVSPAGGQETDWVITVLRPLGIIYFVCVAPQSAYDNYERTFTAILDSVRFQR